jgi:two-component system CheB/CheR fusion protein
MAFVLVQHLAPTHDSILSELLSKSTVMPVIEVTEGTTVDPNKVFVIPPNAEMSIVNGILHLSPLSPDRARRMPIDLFLRSLAEDQHGRAIGVILSGTASDGTLGIQAIKAMGGVTFAQDDDTAKYNAMPRNAVAGGNVDFVLPPHLIARELRRIASHVHLFPPDELTELPEPPGKNDTIARIYNLLRTSVELISVTTRRERSSAESRDGCFSTRSTIWRATCSFCEKMPMKSRRSSTMF